MESQRTFISTIHGGDQEDQHQNLTKPSYRLTFLVYLSHSSLAKVKCRLVASINRRSIPRIAAYVSNNTTKQYHFHCHGRREIPGT